jgi:uncharacterized protein (TIGR02246 family)
MRTAASVLRIGLYLMLCVRLAPAQSSETAAMAGIEAAHRRDVAATLTQDPAQLLDLWTDDGVLIGEGNAPIVGKAAIQSQMKQAFATRPKLKVLKYVPDIKDVQIAGGIAYEWGFFDATSQEGDARPVSFRARYMRVLRRQSNGSWKFARVLWATDK